MLIKLTKKLSHRLESISFLFNKITNISIPSTSPAAWLKTATIRGGTSRKKHERPGHICGQRKEKSIFASGRSFLCLVGFHPTANWTWLSWLTHQRRWSNKRERAGRFPNQQRVRDRQTAPFSCSLSKHAQLVCHASAITTCQSPSSPVWSFEQMDFGPALVDKQQTKASLVQQRSLEDQARGNTEKATVYRIR